MEPFKYVSSSDAKKAVGQIESANSAYLGGGTTLIDLMKLHVLTPTQLVDVTTLPLKSIHDRSGYIEVDAMVTNNEMAHHAAIKSHFPFISEALLSGASVQLRNLATTAGNMLQRTRCSYFRDPQSRCNKRQPGSGCDALDGFNRMHAILGVSEQCIASHPSDMCVALMAAGATVKLLSKEGAREVAFDKFYTLPEQTPHIETVLKPGELITSITIPKHAWMKRSTYVKIRDRSSYAFALTSAAVAIEVSGGRVTQARIALGGVGAVPWRARAAEDVLMGQALSAAKYKEAARAALSGAKPKADNAFKVELAQQTLIRALSEVEKKS